MRIGPIKLMRASTWETIHRRLCHLEGLQSNAEGRLAPIPRGETYFADPADVSPPFPGLEAMFRSLDGWTTRFEIEGRWLGGTQALCRDPRLGWLIETLGGVRGARTLELGPLEAAHTATLEQAGAASILAIEGSHAAWLRCLVVKEALGLRSSHFLYGDFCPWVESYRGKRFDVVVASGVLYHQLDPVGLIRRLAQIANSILIWTHVADDVSPHPGAWIEGRSGPTRYRAKRVDHGTARRDVLNWCGSLFPTSLWLDTDSLQRSLADAGYSEIRMVSAGSSDHGPSVLVVASLDRRLQVIPYPTQGIPAPGSDPPGRHLP